MQKIVNWFDHLAKPLNWSLGYRRAFILTLPVSLPLWLLTLAMGAMGIILLMAVFLVGDLAKLMWEPNP